MGNDLNGLTQILTTTLFVDHRIIDAPRGVVAFLAQAYRRITLVVAQIKVGFGPVVGNVNLAVLKGIHGAGINVDVRIQLLESNTQTPAFQQRANRSGSQSLAQRGENSAGDENKLGFGGPVGCFHGL